MLGGYLNKILGKDRDQRTIVTQKNIIISFFVKGLSIFNNLLLVPLTIDYVSAERYGIWLTISSVILWLNFFDFGMGNGLRNNLTMAIAQKDYQAQRKLISTAYLALIIFSTLLGLTLYIINLFVSWDTLLGVSAIYRNELSRLMQMLFLLFCFQFILQLINIILYSFQLSSYVSMNFLLGSIISLLLIVTLKQYYTGSLYLLGVAFLSGNIISLILFTIYFFAIKHPELFPKPNLASIQISRNLLNTGSKFMVIQLAGIIQYQTVNIIISRFFSSNAVTEYNIAYKYFSVLLMIFGIIMTPIWSAVSDAYAKNDFRWIFNIQRKLLKIWYIAIVCSLVMLIFSKNAYHVWIGEKVIVQWETSLGVMIYILSVTFGSIYVNILNGLGKLKTQFYISIVAMIIFIPMCYFFAVYLKLGILGVSISLVLSNVNGIIAAPLEFYYLLKSNSIK